MIQAPFLGAARLRLGQGDMAKHRAAAALVAFQQDLAQVNALPPETAKRVRDGLENMMTNMSLLQAYVISPRVDWTSPEATSALINFERGLDVLEQQLAQLKGPVLPVLPEEPVPTVLGLEVPALLGVGAAAAVVGAAGYLLYKYI